MLLLSPFFRIDSIANNELIISGDLQLISKDTIEVCFSWVDKNNLISFTEAPIGTRETKLWEQTCFEVFIQPAGHSRYFEINLTANKAWNVFEFADYRSPQPPQEFANADVLNFTVGGGQLRAQIKFAGEHFKKIKLSICAVVKLNDLPVSYWSTKHADQKPNFHHFESLFIERNAP